MMMMIMVFWLHRKDDSSMEGRQVRMHSHLMEDEVAVDDGEHHRDV